ncbi:uncharacterized protein SPSK_11022 [Sporothrix schenckii 1099-18]|uniref:Uncharacterized protein n=1 Tax=Sporothrix schenckii 1099-18 TaxID=1397361 RepID=A0A0F2MBQ9_SPOSC|nr:uncharacterized protein SPSK_11022 [Sporothrix schenckii 1099-18]KJR86275.1 hypothetical protein SPSK_11022 [Sporothrix schenckii 1099-18]
MCENWITTVVSGICRHTIEELPEVKQCSKVSGDNESCGEVKDVYFGQTTTRVLCPDCEAAAEEKDSD